MGGYSLVNAEMILLRKATEVGHYNHYHLLSGQDLPIQSQETIQKFFLKNSDKEFVGFDKDIFTYGDRVYYRYFFQELAGKRKSILKSVDKFLLKMQKKLNIKGCGAAWLHLSLIVSIPTCVSTTATVTSIPRPMQTAVGVGKKVSESSSRMDYFPHHTG